MVVCVTFINNLENVIVKQHLLNILKVEQASVISGSASNGGSLLFQVMILFQGAIFENIICSVVFCHQVQYRLRMWCWHDSKWTSIYDLITENTEEMTA